MVLQKRLSSSRYISPIAMCFPHFSRQFCLEWFDNFFDIFLPGPSQGLKIRISALHFSSPNFSCFRFHGYVGGQVKTSPYFWRLVKLSMWAMFVSGVARDMFSRISNPRFFFHEKCLVFFKRSCKVSYFVKLHAVSNYKKRWSEVILQGWALAVS